MHQFHGVSAPPWPGREVACFSPASVARPPSPAGAGKRAAPLVPPKPSLMAKSPAASAPFSGSSPAAAAADPNRLAVLAQTSAQSSVESGPDTTTEGSVYRNAAQWRRENHTQMPTRTQEFLD